MRRFAIRRTARLVFVGRVAAAVSILLTIVTARALLGSSDQAFQFIQEYTGFFTPGITVMLLLELFWGRATKAGALTAAIGSFVLLIGFKYSLPGLPFVNRMSTVFLISVGRAVVVSLLRPQTRAMNRVVIKYVSYVTSSSYNVAALGVIIILLTLYAKWW